MKKIFKTTLARLGCMALMTGFTACQPDEPEDVTPENAKEELLQRVIADYVDKTIVPTYKGMADNAILLADACVAIQEAHSNGTLTQEMIAEAGNYWKLSRDYWEKSEAFLYGAAADYNIDPHIDSWPLDKNMMDYLLEQLRKGNSWDVSNLGFGLLGFHSVEYMLYELSADGNSSLVHSTDYTAEEMTYLVGVAEDLRDQCVFLEASWAGVDQVTAQKQAILEAAELEPAMNYGANMKNAGQAGSTYVTCKEAAEDLVQGCVTIADEVANTKMGMPNSGEDRNYIESPYALNSIVDFVGNIVSIENAYAGSHEGDASLSDYIKRVDADLDARVRAQIEAAKAAIGVIPEPFFKMAQGAATDNAIDVVNALVEILEDDVMNALGKEMK